MGFRTYSKFNYPSHVPGGRTLLTGIRGVNNQPRQVYISGFYQSPEKKITAFVYKGNLDGDGKFHDLAFPEKTATNLYGPNNGCKKNQIQVVGNYTSEETGERTIGCLYVGPLDGSGKWTTLIPYFPDQEPTINTIAHSTMGGLVVGNYDIRLDQAKAFIYDICKKKYYKIVKPRAKSITAYGIWHNCDDSYTICGGYSNVDPISGIGAAYLVDYCHKTHKFSNWRSYNYDNDPDKAILTHFNGITKGKDGYNLTGDWLGFNQERGVGFYATVKRKEDCKFGKAKWYPVSFPLLDTKTSGNSVYKSTVIGVYRTDKSEEINGYISLLQN